MIALVAGLTVAESKGVDYVGVYALWASAILVTLRRVYLKLKPYWWSRLRDIPKYFKAP